MPTKESVSGLVCTELPAIVAGMKEPEVGFNAIIGLETGGLKDVMPIKVLDTEFGTVIPTLLAGKDCDIGRAEEADMPSRVAII